jgi:hypothetical protein
MIAEAQRGTVYRSAMCVHCNYEIQDEGNGWYHLHSGDRRCSE